MHNTQYRCGVAAENVGYNQPPHVDYWMGTGSALPSLPSVYAVGDVATTVATTTTTTTKATTTTTTTTTEATTETTTKAQSSSSTASASSSHSFDNGTSSSYYTIAGNLSKDKGTVSYNGITISQCLKMESSTSISFNASASGTLTMVFGTASAGKSIKIDGTAYTIPSNGVLTVALSSGSHTVKKGSGSSLLYYISFASAATATTTKATTTTTTTETTTETTTADPYARVSAKKGVYDFSAASGELTADSSYGGAYCLVTGSSSDGTNRVVLSDGMALLEDTDSSATTNLILPITADGDKITVTTSLKPATASGNWSLLQIRGTDTNGNSVEIAGIRTSNGTYKLRTKGDSDNLTDTGVSVSAGTEVSCSIVIDIANQKAYLTVGNSTVSADIACTGLDEVRFVTATAARNLYVGKTTVSE
jgi:hypothetical protein